MNNQAIREAAKNHGVKLWQIANALGVQDSAFSRKLRYELPDAEQRKIISIITQIAKEEQV